MGSVRSYRDLGVWQKAMDLAVAIHEKTKCYPSDERYGLISQTRRATGAIPANIAEGQGRTHIKEYLNFLSTANGSLMELETHVILAERLNYLSSSDVEMLLQQTAEIGKMLNGLMRSLATKV
jgi:four helix bundle protein